MRLPTPSVPFGVRLALSGFFIGISRFALFAAGVITPEFHEVIEDDRQPAVAGR